jgi:2-oxoglutarate dehydrogenase E1 component
MTPKSLLRHKLSVSPLSDLSTGRFQTIVPEIEDIEQGEVTRVVFCSGKVYYDLLEARQAENLPHVALIRIEQLYPFPVEEYAVQIAAWPKAEQIVWCQEEPQNQGAWYQIRHRLQEPLSDAQQLYYAGRPSAAAPAVGILKIHLQQQQALIAAALGSEIKASRSNEPERKAKKRRSKTGKSRAGRSQ